MNIIKIETDNMVNGPGIRVVLWVSGCRHACPGCHNKETWNFYCGEKYTEAHLKTILNYLSKNHISGLTISGGDPLDYMNITDVRDICKIVHETFPEKSIWVYTGGKYEDFKYDRIMEYIDVLVDGEFIQDLKDKPKVAWRGSSNQRLIDVKESQKTNSIKYIDS